MKLKKTSKIRRTAKFEKKKKEKKETRLTEIFKPPKFILKPFRITRKNKKEKKIVENEN